MDDVKQGAGNLAAGLVRGAGSIGATILAPVDIAKDALDGKGLSLASNRERRAQMDAGLQTMGAEPDSWMYKGGKLAGEIAGTAGAGVAVAQGLSKVAPGASALAEAISTAGMKAGGAGMATRMAGGAINGAVSAGMVNPEDATLGAMIGGAAPVVVKGLGMAGSKLGQMINGPAQSPAALKAVEDARALGYVIPPTQAKPTLANRMLEGFSGKLTTAQNASAKNGAVTDGLAAQALGLAPDVKITPDVLTNVRKAAGQAYDAIANTGTITPPATYTQALNNIAAPFVKAAQGFPNAKPSPVLDLVESLKSPSFDAAAAIEKIKQLRSAADDAFKPGGNTDVARASKAAANALEDAVESHLSTIGSPDLLGQFRDARQLIAKTYTVEKALNPTTGTVDARKLGQMLEKGKPLSGELRQAGEFANRFPKAAQTVEKMGSLPQSSPLDWAAAGSMAAATSNPLMLAGVVARPAARALSLSSLVQNRLSTPAGNSSLRQMLGNPDLQQLLLRSAPVAATN
ncbi:MAG: hypothetical protein HYX42_04005 [Polaromonas sp.]|uniref:hypothetical protein n=1 Tax=Polaromonas sp. TaxID=1869339 RepID=UPI0025FF3720|nr:hypothetical protein [Polaromonas sp.]MBI2725394.1 hypothetical protein [Polaromonas sp.]